MSLAASIRKGMRPVKGRDVVLHEVGSTDDIISAMLLADKFAAADSADVAEQLRGKDARDTCRRVWQFVRDSVRYRRDPLITKGGRKMSKEMVKSPSRTLKDGFADCKSMSILVASFLKNLNIPHQYRFAAYDDDREVTHVYVIASPPGSKKDIVIDATYHRFDQEVPFKFKRDKKADMAEIHYISRQASNQAISQISPDEYADRGKEVPDQTPLDYSTMSDGGLRLRLLREQISIFEGFYPEKRAVYQQGKNLIDRALRDGVNNLGKGWFTGPLPPEVQVLAEQMIRAKFLDAPAGLIRTPKSDTTLVNVNGVGELIPVPDCDSLIGFRSAADIQKCNSQREDIIVMNKHLEKNGLHVLYLFEERPNAQPPLVTTKSLLHRTAVSTIHNITDLGVENLRLWLRNGVLRNTAQGGMTPTQPEEGIYLLKTYGPNAGAPTGGTNTGKLNGIGDPVTLTLALIGLIGTAIGAAAALVKEWQATKRARLLAAAQGFSTPEFGPEKDDFADFKDDTDESLIPGVDNTTMMIAGGLLVGGLILNTSTKKR